MVKVTRAGVGLTLVVGALVAALAPAPAGAVQTAQATGVNAVPAAFTPAVNDGVVYAIAQVGSAIYLGGSFTSVTQRGTSSAVPVTGTVAFTTGTGALTRFAPTLDGAVHTIIAGPAYGTVYVGGNFKTVDGVTSKLALLDATTGAMAYGWKSPKLNGVVNKLLLADGQLFVGGTFTSIGGQPRNGLATLNPTTGAVTSYSTLAFTGHHNYGVHCTGTNCAKAGVGIKSMDATPDGTRMVVVGNFTNVSGSARDQVAMLDLGNGTTTVDAGWNTDGFTAGCSAGSFDSYIRDVQFAPDGSYFVIGDTGAGGTGARNIDGTKAICDAVARYETNGTGNDVQPSWVDWTGNDTFWCVSVTGTAIYVGGHQRWVNNSKGWDAAAPGAVPRPGLVAVDPQNGLPLAWNPGRNPRGAGAYALLATPDGLYVGSDTDWIGDFAYHRQKIALFPLAGGAPIAPVVPPTLPGTVYLFGPSGATSTVRALGWSGTSAPVTAGAPSFDASNVRGAFVVRNTLYFGGTDGNLYQATFDGTTVGTPVLVDPYDDPTWSTVATGSGSSLYRGMKPTFYGELPSVTSMFYANGRVYYTLAGKSHLFYRYFEPDDGVVGCDEFTTTDSIDWSHVAGAFLTGGTQLYYADSSTGRLMTVAFSGTQPTGAPTVADSSVNWASHGAVLLPGSAS